MSTRLYRTVSESFDTDLPYDIFLEEFKCDSGGYTILLCDLEAAVSLAKTGAGDCPPKEWLDKLVAIVKEHDDGCGVDFSVF